MKFKLKYLILVFFLNSSLVASENIKVLMFLPNFPSITQIFIYNQAAGLIERGVDVSFFSPKRTDHGVVHDIIKQYDLESRVHYQIPKDLNQFDVIHFQFADLAARYINHLSLRGFNGKKWMSIRGHEVAVWNFRRKIKSLTKRIDRCFSVSYDLKKDLTFMGFNPQKIEVLHSSLDLDQFLYRKPQLPENGKVKILTVGRLAEMKGMDDSIKAVAQVVKHHPEVEYNIIGAGALKPELEKLIENLGLENHVHLLGAMSSDRVIQALQESHLFMLASHKTPSGLKEGIPNALKEAMAIGLPVVSTLHAGNGELVENGVSGYLVPERDVDALTDRLLYLIDHPEVWESLCLEARKTIEEEYDMEKNNDRYYQLVVDSCCEKGE